MWFRPFTARARGDCYRDEHAKRDWGRPATPAPRPCTLALATAPVSTRVGGESRRVEWIVVVGHSGTHASRAAAASRQRLNPDVRPGETSLSSRGGSRQMPSLSADSSHNRQETTSRSKTMTYQQRTPRA